ncbi:MAG: SpoIID/LytB domain-containing protein [Actinomycetota bacterium]
MRCRARRLVLATLVAIAILPIGIASASGGFSFYGSGDGHGLGMSQWGAYGLAQMGWDHQRILTHFYQGTAVDTPTGLPRSIRVGLTSGRSIVHLRAQVGPVRLWLGSAGGALIGKIPVGDTWSVVAKQHAWAVRTHDGHLVGGHLWGGAAKNLIATYADTGARVFIPEADAIWYQGFSYGRGSIEMNLTSCGDGDGCVERLIARVHFEDYLRGLGEVPAAWPMEAMRAQAVAARTYAAYDMKHYGRRADCNCDITDGASDQTYIGWNREGGTEGDRWVKAVTSTAGQVVTYRGTLIQAFYAASDGGHSDSVQDVWHGGDPAYAIPWLTGVCDPGESTGANPWTDWTKTYAADDVTSRLAPYTGSIGKIRRFDAIHRGDGGRIINAVAVGGSGDATVTGSEMKAALGWYDERVWINSDRTIRGQIRDTYDRVGCRPGLPTSPQRMVHGGSQQFFASGGVYANRASGFTVWLRGAIDREFRAVDAAAGVLGVPTSAPAALTLRSSTCRGCKRIMFAGGRIYFSPAAGAHALWGNILAAYLHHGGAGGALGLPATRVLTRPAGGVHAGFQHGHIACLGGSCTVSVG